MIKSNYLLPIFISFFLLLFISCNQNDEQRKFEREALSLPENFTETRDNGSVVEGNSDPDDWRIAPFFQGIVSFEKLPSPNPLLTNQQLNFELYVIGIDGVSGLRVLVLYNENNVRPLYEYPGTSLPTGLAPVSLDALEIAQIPENPEGLYRLIIQDWDGNIISYGDVKIE